MPSILVNGDLETGSLVPWLTTSNWQITSNPAKVRSGTYAMEMLGGGNPSGLPRQDIADPTQYAGLPATFSFWVKIFNTFAKGGHLWIYDGVVTESISFGAAGAVVGGPFVKVTVQRLLDADMTDFWVKVCIQTTNDEFSVDDGELLIGMAPTATTSPATEVEEETATGPGNITDDGGEDCDKRGICWNDTGNPTVADNKSEETDSFGTGAFSRPITGLSPGTKHYFKAYAHNSEGYGYGGEESFTTKPNAPSNLACAVQSSSQIDVNWIKGTGATKTMVRRKVGSYPIDVTDGDQAYYDTGNSFNDTSLVPATHYYYRAWSWVEGGDIWSDDYAEDNAWTLIGASAVTTDPATGLAAVLATLNGTLDDDGGEACECGFEWGLDTGYGTTTPPQSKTTGETFSQVIGGLVQNTTYHFRAFATNSVGTSHGDDRSFTTALVISRAFALAREEL